MTIFLFFGGLLNLCFILYQCPHNFLKGLIFKIKIIFFFLWYSTIGCMTKMKLKVLIGDVIANGSKPIIIL
jgi:hypothetical protein